MKTIVIIGRPNVGKSSIFNRLFGRRRALVYDTPGVTRDRLIESVQWGEETFRIVDTGGIGGETFNQEIEEQVAYALEKATLVLMVFDGQTGFTPHDADIMKRLHQSGLLKNTIPLIGLINKADTDVHEDQMIHDFYQTGIEELYCVSAEHDRGIETLKRRLQIILGEISESSKLTQEDSEPHLTDDTEPTDEVLENEERVENSREHTHLHLAIVGRPNVGKSTLTNALLGEERMITSPIAGTTVDSIDSIIEMGGIQATLIDTAGIRRKSKTDEGVEVLSVVQTKKALERCDVALLMIDGEEGVTDQDEKIGSLIEEVGCGVMLVVNKWDLHRHGKPGEKALKPEEAVEVVRNRMGYLKYAPILFVSAKKKTGLEDILPIAQQIHEERKVKITTHEFTEWVRKEATVHNPTNVKFYLCHQSGRHPPTFVFHCSQPDKIHFSLKRHFSNVIREKWGYMGSPLRLVFVKGKNNSR